jgi:hypothetical protein
MYFLVMQNTISDSDFKILNDITSPIFKDHINYVNLYIYILKKINDSIVISLDL